MYCGVRGSERRSVISTGTGELGSVGGEWLSPRKPGETLSAGIKHFGYGIWPHLVLSGGFHEDLAEKNTDESDPVPA